MPFQLQEVNLSTTIEIPIYNQSKSKIKFVDVDSSLDYARIHSLSFMAGTGRFAPSGRPLIYATDLEKAFLTLADTNNSIYNTSMPIELLLNAAFDNFQLNPKIISIKNSYIEIPQINALTFFPAGGVSIVLTFFYKKLEK